MFDFHSFSLWLNLAIFLGSAVLIWFAGTNLSRYADTIAERTGIGRAFIGALLLGGITSLPELASTVSASALGNAPLAVNNLFGGVAMQVAILAVADAFVPAHPLSRLVKNSSPLLQGALLIVILTIAVAGITVGDANVLGVGVTTSLIFLTALVAFYLVHKHEEHDAWTVAQSEEDEEAANEKSTDDTQEETAEASKETPSTRTLVLKTAGAALVILGAGYVLAKVGDALASQTGLGSSFVGAVLVAVSTSLPEVSTTFSAVMLGQYGMAFANIFGTNILDVAVLFVADLVYPKGPVLSEVGKFSIAGIVIGMGVTAVYMAGLLLRRDRVLWRVGIDSLLVLLLYGGGLVVLYTLR